MSMGLSPTQTNELFESEGVKPAGGPISDNQLDKITAIAKETGPLHVTDVAFFRALGFSAVKAIDLDPSEGAEVILDLNKDVPRKLLGTCDLLVDGSTLDNLFDPITALRNAVRLLSAHGRLCMSVQGNYSLSFNGIPYLIMTPIWLYDYFVANRFEECSIYASIWNPDEGRQTTYVLNHENATRRWGLGLMRPVIVDLHLQISVFCRRGPRSTFDRNPQQHVYRGEAEWLDYERTVRGYMALDIAPHVRSTFPMMFHVVPSGWNVVLPNGAVLNPESGSYVRN
jgi:hypothetical protein